MIGWLRSSSPQILKNHTCVDGRYRKMCLRGSCVSTLKNHTRYTIIILATHGYPNFWSMQIWMIWIITSCGCCIILLLLLLLLLNKNKKELFSYKNTNKTISKTATTSVSFEIINLLNPYLLLQAF